MNTWRIQGLRYIIVGLASNLTLYLLYLVLTTIGMGHKTTMTLLYLTGILQTFFLNKRWTFTHSGGSQKSLARYLAVYASFYLLNLGVLHLFVDQFAFPHAFVQGAFMVTIVGPLFLLQKYWIFPQGSASSPILDKAI
ncbi:MAG: GtrA family protein [Candidatus Competibacteraceae bacterium]|nr:GtrA family protein [Candidatus Competibacteraceae bacterium]